MDGASKDTHPEVFDFEAHEAQAVRDYRRQLALYEGFAEYLRGILQEALRRHHIRAASVDARAKGLNSFAKKAAAPSSADPGQPKYGDPLKEITDLAGVRVITFFPQVVEDVDRAVKAEFEVVRKENKGDALNQEERFGYSSVHYLVRLGENHTLLPEYSRYSELTGEIQVRTILQHAWAEIEHDIQYKSREAIPASIRRRFMSLAGMLEIADREFQAIQNEDQRLRRAARHSIAQGRLADVELGPDALKAYLDRRLGPDGRMAESNYEQWVTALYSLGFTNLQQIDDCIRGLDDKTISRHIWGSRQGQVTRFEGLLLAGMGRYYLERHPNRHVDWFVAVRDRWLDRLQDEGVQAGGYRPVRHQDQT
jgi:ppGpp synthetase/RelA/SpoT-type nucleotidyltranferase